MYVAKQYVRHSFATAFSRLPGFNDGGNMLCRPRNRKWSAIDKHQDYRRARCLNGLDQIILCACQIETGNIVGFSICRRNITSAGVARMLANDDNSDTRMASDLNRLGEILFAADHLAALYIHDRRRRRNRLLDAIEHSRSPSAELLRASNHRVDSIDHPHLDQ